MKNRKGVLIFTWYEIDYYVLLGQELHIFQHMWPHCSFRCKTSTRDQEPYTRGNSSLFEFFVSRDKFGIPLQQNSIPIHSYLRFRKSEGKHYIYYCIFFFNLSIILTLHFLFIIKFYNLVEYDFSIIINFIETTNVQVLLEFILRYEMTSLCRFKRIKKEISHYFSFRIPGLKKKQQKQN